MPWRAITRAALVPLLAVLLVWHASTAADLASAAAEERSPSVPGRCARPAPTSAAGYQAMFDAKNDEGWSGGDQAASVVLPDGRVLWLFADTIQGRAAPNGGYAAGVRLVRNSFLLQDGGCLSSVAGPQGGEVIPTAADGSYFWPQAGLVDRGRLVVLALRMRATGGGPLAFAIAGTVAAVFRLTSGPPLLERIVPLPAQPGRASDPAYGVAALRVGGYSYVYGTAAVTGAFGKAVYVARAPVGRLLTPAAWRFWTGAEWSRAARAARPVVAAAPRGWSTSFSVWPQADGRLRMLTKENEFLGTDLVTGVATSPVGPFTRQVVARIPSGVRQGEVRYTPLAHPQGRLPGGALLVSYSRNRTSPSAVLADADYYKPQFLAVRPG